MPQSAGRLWSPRPLRHAPIDPFEKIAELRRRDRHRPVRRRGPDEAATLKPLGKQAHPLAVVPQHLDQSAAPAAEHEQMATVRITLELLLHQQRQSIKTLAHVRMAARQPNPHAARDRDHRRRSPPISAAIVADTVATSTEPVIRSRAPVANSISITPQVTASGGASVATATAANAGTARRRSHNSRRQRYNWLTWIPDCRAIYDATAPGSSVAATIRSLSVRDHRRRRSTDVITSTRAFVI